MSKFDFVRDFDSPETDAVLRRLRDATDANPSDFAGDITIPIRDARILRDLLDELEADHA